MSEVEVSSFNSVEEELEYWKRKSLEYCERCGNCSVQWRPL